MGKLTDFDPSDLGLAGWPLPLAWRHRADDDSGLTVASVATEAPAPLPRLRAGGLEPQRGTVWSAAQGMLRMGWEFWEFWDWVIPMP